MSIFRKLSINRYIQMKETIHKKLNELQATAICGNDISSSCLYVSALTIMYAGQYAWISLLIVAVVLYLFRKIYGEVVGAIPLNGGAYNVLLNTSSKKWPRLRQHLLYYLTWLLLLFQPPKECITCIVFFLLLTYILPP